MKEKLAIFAPNILPVPAVCGGAVEELITYFIEENEINHLYDIEVYTMYHPKLKNVKYKYTNLIELKPENGIENLKILPRSYKIKNKINVHLFGKGPVTPLSDYMVSKFKQDYYDIVLVEDNKLIYESLSKKLHNERVYFHMHNDFNIASSVKGIQKLIHTGDLYIVNKIIKNSTKIITVSNFLKRKLEKMGANNVVTVYNCVDQEQLKPVPLKNRLDLRTKYGLSQNDVVFGYIGRLDPNKGADKILFALKKLEYCSNIKCIVVGKNWLKSTAENQFVKKMSALSQSIQDKVTFTGYIEHSKINEIYSIIDCLVIPTQIEEAFGVVALEAMIMGVPILASDSGALPEVLGKNSGVIIKRGKDFVSSLADSMKKIAFDKEFRQKLKMDSKERSKAFITNKSTYFNQLAKVIK